MKSRRRVNSTVMRLQQTFDEAVISLQDFLRENNRPTDLFWVFRDDLWKRSVTDVLVKYPVSAKNLPLAKKVFSEGCARGLVDVHAVATVGSKTAASVWFPKFDHEKVQGWDCGLKLTMTEPLPDAKIVNPLRWWFFRFIPRFRHYQQFEWTVGTKQWAAA